MKAQQHSITSAHFNLYFRSHAKLKMKHLSLLLLVFCLISTSLKAQTCTYSLKGKIIAPSGMRIRSQPNLKASVVTYIPFDSALVACADNFGAMTYEKIEGFWRKVQYKTFEGYMFDGFMELTGQTSVSNADLETDSTLQTSGGTIANPTKTTISTKASAYSFMTETYNYCGDVSGLDPGLLWYAILPKPEKGGGENYRIKRVEVDVVLSKQKVGKGLEFDIITQDEERSIFLFGVNRPLDVSSINIEDQSDRYRYGGRKIYPGQQVALTEGKDPISLAASGTVEGSGPCPALKEYKLILQGKKYYLDVKQNLTEELLENGQCGMPELYWYGDLTGDDVPEVIFVSVYKEKNTFTLFVSNPNKDNILLEKASEWVVEKCY